MKLNERVQPASHLMTNYDQIEYWLEEHRINNYTIHPNGVVNGDVDISDVNLYSIPIQFGRVSDNFICRNNALTSLDGVPYYIGVDFACYFNRIVSFSGIHKLIKHIGDQVVCDEDVTNILGLMLIDGLQDVILDAGPIDTIMNRHLQGNRDILMCQQELIEAGYAAQAKL